MINLIHKKIIIPIVILGAFATIALTATGISAQTRNDPFSGIAAAIAQKFNLNQTDVQSVITEYRQTKRTDMFTTRLDKLVVDKKITSDQKSAIINELQSKPKPADFKAWLKSQNLDESIIPFGLGRIGRMHQK
ncbi:hypothetical protein BH10PAT1_BH10PAT1_5290 [soil metagenome]